MKLLETLLTVALRTPVVKIGMEQLLEGFRRASVGAMKRAQRDLVRPREWSNAELQKVAGHYDGGVINVSGWRDEDKAGSHYRKYFANAADYVVSNFRGERGMADGEEGVYLDLEGEVPAELQQRYQVAFNHTTLEHVFDIRRAVANICALSYDTVILVTPFLQAVHYEEGSYGDYWRPTPMCLTRMLEEQGFTTVYQSSNDNPWHIVYVFTVAVRSTENHAGGFPASVPPQVGLRHFDTT